MIRHVFDVRWQKEIAGGLVRCMHRRGPHQCRVQLYKGRAAYAVRVLAYDDDSCRRRPSDDLTKAMRAKATWRVVGYCHMPTEATACVNVLLGRLEAGVDPNQVYHGERPWEETGGVAA